MLISVVGLGYIGLPTAALLASRGMRVLGVDINPRVVETVNKGLIHIVEADLDAVVYSTVGKGLLRAVTKPRARRCIRCRRADAVPRWHAGHLVC